MNIVCSLIDNEQPKVQTRNFGWTTYQTYDEIYAWLDTLLATYSSVLTNQDIGISYEGRKIRGVRLAHAPVRINNSSSTKE